MTRFFLVSIFVLVFIAFAGECLRPNAMGAVVYGTMAIFWGMGMVACWDIDKKDND